MAEENHAAQRQTAVTAYFKIKQLLLLSSNPLKPHYSPKHRVTFMKTDLVYKKSAKRNDITGNPFEWLLGESNVI